MFSYIAENVDLDPKVLFDYVIEEVSKSGIPDPSFDYQRENLIIKRGGILAKAQTEEILYLVITDALFQSKVLVLQYGRLFSVTAESSRRAEYQAQLDQLITDGLLDDFLPYERKADLFATAINGAMERALERCLPSE